MEAESGLGYKPSQTHRIKALYRERPCQAR